MPIWSKARNLWRNLFAKRVVAQDLDDEVRAYVEMATEEKIAAGATPEEARRATLAEIGGTEALKEAVRENSIGSGIESFIQDLQYGVRQVIRAPGFGITVIATLALSIGISVAVFSVLYAMLIRALPYQDTASIVALDTRSANGGTQFGSWPEYVDWRNMTHSFQALAGFMPAGTVGMESDAGAVVLREIQGTDNFFQVFGVNAILGRTFIPGEDQDGRNDVVVLSYEVWKQDFGGLDSVIGRRVKMDGSMYTVIGVMPAGFRFPINITDGVYVPLHLSVNMRENRGNHWLQTVARLKTGIMARQAEADLNTVFAALGKNDAFNAGRTVSAVDLATYVVGNSRSSLRLLLYAVLAVLLIGCVNVAGLMLARSVRRDREMALRLALGGRRARIVRQLLTGSLIFAICGAAAGIVVAYGLLALTRLLLIAALSRGAEVGVHFPVLVFALAISGIVTVAAAIIPAVRMSGTAPTLALKSGGSAGTSRGQHRLRSGFVIVQVALAFALLVVSGLLLQMLRNLRSTRLGFSPYHILTAEVNLPRGRYQGRDILVDFYEPLLQRIKTIPGVHSAGLIQMLPVQGWGWNSEHIHIMGTPPLKSPRTDPAEIRFVSPGYYQVFQDQLIEGRLQDPSLDRPTTRLVCVVNEAFVKKFIPPGRDPVGMEIGDDGQTQTLASQPDPRILIVGVVKDIRQTIYQPPLPEMDFLASQVPPQQGFNAIGTMRVVMRTAIEPTSLVPALRHALQETDSAVPLHEPETMQEVIAEVLTFERLENWLFGAFAALAVVLALVGLYGLISHEVELSSRGIGIRLALGATRAEILSGIYQRVGRMMIVGVVIGLALTLAVQRFISAVVAFKFDKDGPFLAELTILMMAIGLLASTLPALRASSIQPTEMLHRE